MEKINVLYINSPKYDLVTALHIEGMLKLDNVELWFTSLGNYAPKNRVLDRKDAEAFANNFADIVILGSRPWVDRELFLAIQKKNVKRVILEGGDGSALDTPTWMIYKADKLFKRELYIKSSNPIHFFHSLKKYDFGLWSKIRANPIIPFPNFHSMKSLGGYKTILKNILVAPFQYKVLPFPLGIEERMVGEFNPDPQWEVSCIMRPHTKERRELLSILKSSKQPKIFLDPIHPLQSEIDWMVNRGACHPSLSNDRSIGMAQNFRYLNQLNNSRASISIPGGGSDTLRFWEILAQGSLLVSKRISLQLPDAPIEGEHYLAFDSADEFKEVVDFIYRYPDRVDVIRRNGWDFALKHHTSKSRALYFYEKLFGHKPK